MPDVGEVRILTAAFGDLDAATLYRILRLRAEVFVVEQDCPYLDPDGRDDEPGTRHCWVADGADGAGVAAYLRLLTDGVADDADRRIGRVVTAPRARGRGHAAALVAHALRLAGPRPVVLDAQSHLVDWYARHGFAVDGAEFVEDGIPHTPMRRQP